MQISFLIVWCDSMKNSRQHKPFTPIATVYVHMRSSTFEAMDILAHNEGTCQSLDMETCTLTHCNMLLPSMLGRNANSTSARVLSTDKNMY
jgi:hypothetical protein